MKCKNCGLDIERVPESASAIQYVHSQKVNGAKFSICAYAFIERADNTNTYYDPKTGYLTAEPMEEGRQ